MVAAIALCATARTAHATVGGETVVDVLGWDPTAKRVYFHEQTFDAAGEFGTVWYFECSSARFGARGQLRWTPTRPDSGDGTSGDPGLNARLAALRSRLKPLPTRAGITFPWKWKTRVLSRDSLAHVPEAPRFRVLVSFEQAEEFEVTTFHDTNVVRKAVYAIPGRKESLVLLSYTGHSDEGGYEVQVPVLVPAGAHAPIPVNWSRAGE